MFKSNLTTKFDGKGLEPWYDVVKSFVHAIQRDDLPYSKHVVILLYSVIIFMSWLEYMSVA